MTSNIPPRLLLAANQNPGGASQTTLALHGLVALMAKAELRAATRDAANHPTRPTDKEISQ